jgi:hypothetical protein
MDHKPFENIIVLLVIIACSYIAASSAFKFIDRVWAAETLTIGGFELRQRALDIVGCDGLDCESNDIWADSGHEFELEGPYLRVFQDRSDTAETELEFHLVRVAGQHGLAWYLPACKVLSDTESLTFCEGSL